MQSRYIAPIFVYFARKKLDMNKSDYLRTAKLLNLSVGIPTEENVESVIAQIEARLSEKVMNRSVNLSVKEGYAMAVDMLRRRQKDYAGIETLSTPRARAVAALAADYLNGECSEAIFCHVPIKRF